MPQMSPIYWLVLLMYFIFMLMMLIFFISPLPSIKLSLVNSKMLMDLMW